MKKEFRAKVLRSFGIIEGEVSGLNAELSPVIPEIEKMTVVNINSLIKELQNLANKKTQAQLLDNILYEE